jgi:hypothetical protein
MNNSQDSQNSQSSLQSVDIMDFSDSFLKYGQCTDSKSLKRIDTKLFLNKNNDRILIISDGYKIGYRKKELDEYFNENNGNMYKNNQGDYFIYTTFGKMIPMKDFMNFFIDKNRVFIFKTLYTQTDLFTSVKGGIIHYPNCEMKSYTLEEYKFI